MRKALHGARTFHNTFTTSERLLQALHAVLHYRSYSLHAAVRYADLHMYFRGTDHRRRVEDAHCRAMGHSWMKYRDTERKCIQ